MWTSCALQVMTGATKLLPLNLWLSVFRLLFLSQVA